MKFFLTEVLSYSRNVIYPTSNPPSTGISPSALGSSFPAPATLQIARLQYLLLWISFVLITRINDCFGYLNASFRGTWLPCHGYELQAGLCFTWGSLSSFPHFRYTHTRGVDQQCHCDNNIILILWKTIKYLVISKSLPKIDWDFILFTDLWLISDGYFSGNWSSRAVETFKFRFVLVNSRPL